MSAAEIKALTQPPSAEHAQAITLRWLNDNFPDFDQLQDQHDLEQLVQHSASEAEQLRTQVNHFPFLSGRGCLLSRRSSASLLTTSRRLYNYTNPARRQCVPGVSPGIGSHQRLAFRRVVLSVQ